MMLVSFTCNYTVMRYLGIIILLIALSSGCRSDKCTRTFSKDFGLSILPVWAKQTDMNLADRKNDTLMSLFKSAAKDSISFFERERFIKNLSSLKELEGYRFDSLIVVEVNSSGEVYLRTKYLLVSCGQETTIIKFRLGLVKWDLIQVHKVGTNNVDEAMRSIIDRNDNTVYWGGNVNDLVAVSKFRENNEISVEVFGSLNKKQYDALDIMEK